MGLSIRDLLKIMKNTLKYNVFLYLRYIVLPNNTCKFNEYKNKKKIILMQTPEHHNLGDHAIAYAETKFAKDNFPEYEIIEIPRKEVYKNAKALRKILSNDDKIFIIGGGNMGDMYIYEEYTRRFISKYFRKFKIISFPQSIDFSNSWMGRYELLKSCKAYAKNKNMVIIARETKSYEIMKSVFKNKVILTPDIVLYLSQEKGYERTGIVTCLRADLEDAIGKDTKKSLLEKIKNKYNSVIITDTLTKEIVKKEERGGELEKIWRKFGEAELVITDRLHGMIFCAITGTPCIALSNSNHKIEYTYKNWLKDLEYIKFMKNFNEDEIIKEIDKTINIKSKKIYGMNLNKKYEKLYEVLDISI